jgi:hypothetical protein
MVKTTNLIEARKAKQGNIDDDEDFVVGTIAGLDDEDTQIMETVKELNKRSGKTLKGDEVAMPTKAVEKQNVVSPESLEGTVMLKLRKQYFPLVDTIVKNNDNVIVQEFDNYFQINAKQIKVTRQDGERALGRLNDGQWRVLFVNRQGEVSNFNDYEFVLGVVETEVEETKETAQLNTRIDSKCKMDMDEVREMLGMTQAKFLEVAITEYVQKVRAEML